MKHKEDVKDVVYRRFCEPLIISKNAADSLEYILNHPVDIGVIIGDSLEDIREITPEELSDMVKRGKFK